MSVATYLKDKNNLKYQINPQTLYGYSIFYVRIMSMSAIKRQSEYLYIYSSAPVLCLWKNEKVNKDDKLECFGL